MLGIKGFLQLQVLGIEGFLRLQVLGIEGFLQLQVLGIEGLDGGWGGSNNQTNYFSCKMA